MASLTVFILLVAFLSFIFLLTQKIYSSYVVANIFKNGKVLLLFQNNAEMRPSGGFIGSFAVAEFDNFKVKKIDFNTNIYKLDNDFTAKTTITPPKVLETITKGKWAMRDANFDPDFLVSARQVLWFYTQESGQSADAVVAVNATVLRDLLKITGPIELEKYQTTITSDNFLFELASKIEKEYFQNKTNWQVNEPKTILKDLMSPLFDKALGLSKLKLTLFLNEQLKNKQILLYSKDEKIQQAVEKNNFGGRINLNRSDFLYVSNANISDNSTDSKLGGKSSLSVRQNIEYKVSKANSLVAELNLYRIHTGSYNWPDGNNHNYTQILVPKGSKLTGAILDNRDVFNGIEIENKINYTVFALFIDVKPQNQSHLQLTYELPDYLSDNYRLLVQKQPGSINDYMKLDLFGKKYDYFNFSTDRLFSIWSLDK